MAHSFCALEFSQEGGGGGEGEQERQKPSVCVSVFGDSELNEVCCVGCFKTTGAKQQPEH